MVRHNKKTDTKKRSAVNGWEHIYYIKMSMVQKEKRCPLLAQIGEYQGGEICFL